MNDDESQAPANILDHNGLHMQTQNEQDNAEDPSTTEEQSNEVPAKGLLLAGAVGLAGLCVAMSTKKGDSEATSDKNGRKNCCRSCSCGSIKTET